MASSSDDRNHDRDDEKVGAVNDPLQPGSSFDTVAGAAPPRNAIATLLTTINSSVSDGTPVVSLAASVLEMGNEPEQALPDERPQPSRGDSNREAIKAKMHAAFTWEPSGTRISNQQALHRLATAYNKQAHKQLKALGYAMEDPPNGGRDTYWSNPGVPLVDGIRVVFTNHDANPHEAEVLLLYDPRTNRTLVDRLLPVHHVKVWPPEPADTRQRMDDQLNWGGGVDLNGEFETQGVARICNFAAGEGHDAGVRAGVLVRQDRSFGGPSGFQFGLQFDRIARVGGFPRLKIDPECTVRLVVARAPGEPKWWRVDGLPYELPPECESRKAIINGAVCPLVTVRSPLLAEDARLILDIEWRRTKPTTWFFNTGATAQTLWESCPNYVGVLMGMMQWWIGGPFDSSDVFERFAARLEEVGPRSRTENQLDRRAYQRAHGSDNRNITIQNSGPQSFPDALISHLSSYGGPGLREFLSGIRCVRINVPLEGVGPERYGGDRDPIVCLAVGTRSVGTSIRAVQPENALTAAYDLTQVTVIISTLMNLFYRTAHHLTLLPALAPRRTFKRISDLARLLARHWVSRTGTVNPRGQLRVIKVCAPTLPYDDWLRQAQANNAHFEVQGGVMVVAGDNLPPAFVEDMRLADDLSWEPEEIIASDDDRFADPEPPASDDDEEGGGGLPSDGGNGNEEDEEMPDADDAAADLKALRASVRETQLSLNKRVALRDALLNFPIPTEDAPFTMLELSQRALQIFTSDAAEEVTPATADTLGDKLNLLQAGSVVAMNLKWIRHSTNVLDSGATEESMLASVTGRTKGRLRATLGLLDDLRHGRNWSLVLLRPRCWPTAADFLVETNTLNAAELLFAED